MTSQRNLIPWRALLLTAAIAGCAAESTGVTAKPVAEPQNTTQKPEPERTADSAPDPVVPKVSVAGEVVETLEVQRMAQSPDETVPDEPTRNGLPAGGTDEGDCDPSPVPAADEWLASADAVVFGTLREIRLMRTPGWYIDYSRDPVYREEPACHDYAFPRMELVLEVRHSIRGALTGQTVTVHTGSKYLQEISPKPVEIQDDGSLLWLHTSRVSGEPLVEGQDLGLAIHYFPDEDLWSILGEPMFTTAEDASTGKDVVVFQRFGSECPMQPPTELEGLTIAEMAQRGAAAAPSLESQARRTQMHGMWAKWPHQYRASLCWNDEG